ncbi:helix-turn-helix domain-containing protein [Nonomuraea sp. NPDC059194]|uniref:helix-turn-helix domain-containing protein n=1 Tax=Nonomuraea sp. NPDC059194 TaxID=3346764 RepID=UPI0036AC40F0
MSTPVRPPAGATVVPLLYKPEEVAVQLRISRTKVYALLRSGEIRSVKIDGCRRIPVAALSEYIARLERKAA